MASANSPLNLWHRMMPYTAAALMGLTVWSTAQADVLADVRKEGRIVLGYRDSAVPFSYVDQGKPVGYGMDVCQRLVSAVRQHLGLSKLDVQTRLVTAANRVDLVEKQQVHLECGSTINNAARREKVAFTIPYFVTGTKIAVKSASTVQQLQDPNLKKVVSTKGSAQLELLRRLESQGVLRAKVVEVTDNDDAMNMLEKGDADAFVMADVLLAGLIAERQNPKAFKIVGDLLTTEALAIMLPKGDAAFKKVIDDEMRRLISSRDIHALYSDWFEKPIAPHQRALNLPMNFLLRDLWKRPTDQVPF